MSLMRLAGYDPQGLQRMLFQGDVVLTNESVPAAQTSNAYTFLGSDLLKPIFWGTPTANATYTLDSAANIINAIAPFFGYNVNAQNTSGTNVYSAIQNGTSWRVRIVNNAAFTITFAATANTGVTVSARNTLAAGATATPNSKDLLVTVTCGAPLQSYFCTSTSGAAVLGGLSQAQLATLAVGMVVTNAQANLQGQTIIGINQANGTVTMSGNANATNAAPGVQFNFSPTITAEVI